MVQCPVRVPRKGCRSSSPSALAKVQEYNRVAQLLEVFINKCIDESEENVVQLSYARIAHAISQREELVRDILFGIDCGHKALTVRKSAAERTSSRE